MAGHRIQRLSIFFSYITCCLTIYSFENIINWFKRARVLCHRVASWLTCVMVLEEAVRVCFYHDVTTGSSLFLFLPLKPSSIVYVGPVSPSVWFSSTLVVLLSMNSKRNSIKIIWKFWKKKWSDVFLIKPLPCWKIEILPQMRKHYEEIEVQQKLLLTRQGVFFYHYSLATFLLGFYYSKKVIKFSTSLIHTGSASCWSIHDRNDCNFHPYLPHIKKWFCKKKIFRG